MAVSSDNSWRLWDHMPAYGTQLERRARGESPEPPHHGALCALVQQVYQRGNSVLDVGCGAGDLYRSLCERVDPGVRYTGLDATESFVSLAKAASEQLPGAPTFAVGDVLDIPCEDASHEIVVCSGVIEHVPPPPLKALRELLRVARDWLLIRTVCGQRNYIIKELKSPHEYAQNGIERSELESVQSEDALRYYNYFNLYTESYYRAAIASIAPGAEVQFLHAPELGHPRSGNLHLEYTAIVVAKG